MSRVLWCPGGQHCWPLGCGAGLWCWEQTLGSSSSPLLWSWPVTRGTWRLAGMDIAKTEKEKVGESHTKHAKKLLKLGFKVICRMLSFSLKKIFLHTKFTKLLENCWYSRMIIFKWGNPGQFYLFFLTFADFVSVQSNQSCCWEWFAAKFQYLRWKCRGFGGWGNRGDLFKSTNLQLLDK